MAHLHTRSLSWRAAELAPLLLPLVLVAACPACRSGTPTVVPRAVGGLLVLCEPADAAVYVDDRFQGNASSLRRQPLTLAEGFHRVEIRKDGYFPHFAEVTIARGVRQSLEVKLRKEPF